MANVSKKREARAEVWKKQYGDWEASGLTQRLYCAQVGLIFGQFKSGVEAARQQGILERANKGGNEKNKVISNLDGFAPVRINPTDTPSPYCEIRFNGKSGARIETVESLGLLRELLGITP